MDSDTGPGPSLLPAIELVAAWAGAGNDSGFFWAAVRRVMEDITGPDRRPDALAELIFGLSSLGGVLLDRLATQCDEDPSALLSAIHLAHGRS